MQKIRTGGLWKHKDNNGNTYLQGKMGAFYVQIRKNDYKKGEHEPDYNMYFTQADKKPNEPDEMLDNDDNTEEL